MGIFKGTKPSIQTHAVKDPLKEDVASPLSSFLAGEMGKGIPRYEGELTASLGQEAFNINEQNLSNISDFLKINPSNFFKENIESPAISSFQEQLAIGKEDFAGRLSGSDRLSTQENRVSKFTRDLAGTRANFLTQMPQAQANLASQGINTAAQVKATKDKDFQVQYQEWYTSLPQHNAALGQALQFLNNSTSTGTDVLSGLDAGKPSWFASLFGAIGGFLGTSGSKAYGGTTGGSSTGGSGGSSGGGGGVSSGGSGAFSGVSSSSFGGSTSSSLSSVIV